MLEHVSFKHDFRRARTHGFRSEIDADSIISEQKLNCERVDHSKNCHAWYLLFCYRKCRRSIGFQRENMFQACISAQNRRMRRQFQAETDGPDAMGASGLSQRRDFGKVDDFETLSL